jgi:septal ring factor EnvC (AmiA/AmiB activator)
MVRTQVPSLAWLLPVVTTKSPSQSQVTPINAQELKPMAGDLAAVRHTVEQLAAQQEQMAAQQAQLVAQQQQMAAEHDRITQSLTALQALEQEIKQKVSSSPPSRTVTAPSRKPLESARQPSAVPPSPVPPARQPLRLMPAD